MTDSVIWSVWTFPGPTIKIKAFLGHPLRKLETGRRPEYVVVTKCVLTYLTHCKTNKQYQKLYTNQNTSIRLVFNAVSLLSWEMK